MKLLHKTLVLLSFAGLGFQSLEAKSLEFLFNHTTQTHDGLKALFNPQISKDTKSETLYCQELTIENKSKEVLYGCYPSINNQTLFTLDSLAKQIAQEPYPALALFKIWNQSLTVVENNSNLIQEDDQYSPLDLLNFFGTCSKEEFAYQFIKLCHQIGIQTRSVNQLKEPSFDFAHEHGWIYCDLNSQQIYFALDNETIVSSESIMDDPFLALRTKHSRYDADVDFKKSWEKLANFAITHPFFAEHENLAAKDAHSRSKGFDIYPQEKLVYFTPAARERLAASEREVEHVINCEQRGLSWEYSSPLPLKSLFNKTASAVYLKDQNVTIQAGETYVFQGELTFNVSIETKEADGQLIVTCMCSKAVFPDLKSGDNVVNLGGKGDASSVQITCDVNENLEKESNASIKILNQISHFDSSPQFLLEDSSENQCEMMWWQISADPSFKVIPSNFEQIGPFTSEVMLSAISETFFNANETYYFRVRACVNGKWNNWSSPFEFTLFKPEPITAVEFGKIDDYYELNWERLYTPDSSSEYLIFGSNSLDFLPSIYSDSQVNSMMDGEVTEAEHNQNLVAITKDLKIAVDGSLAYYRIIVRQGGLLSVPSPIIHVYDDELIQPRNVLQVVEEEEGHPLLKRVLLRPSYPWTQISLPKVSAPSDVFENGLLQLHSAFLRASVLPLFEVRAYQKPAFVTQEIWEAVRPHFLPENHPAKSKLDRMFSATRVIQTPETFRKAGFKRNRPGRFSRIMASSHPDLPHYFIKAFADNELSVKAEWYKFLHRIEGAKCVREWIAKNKLQSTFSVPNKWIYPLPENPSPPNNSHFLRKNFILVAENMRILDHEKNEKAYKNKMTRKLLDDIYRLFDDVGLYDSVYAFNVPFCKDGKLATIDTEYHHRWPVPFHKLKKYFSKDMQKYWQHLIDNGGPKGHIKKGGR